MGAKKETKQECAKAIFRAKHGEQSGAWCYIHAKPRRTAWQAKDARIGLGRCMARMEKNGLIAVILHCWQPCVVSMLTSSCLIDCLSSAITVAGLCPSSSDVKSCAQYSARKMHRRGIVQIIVPKTSPWIHEIKEFQKGTSSCTATTSRSHWKSLARGTSPVF